MNFFAFTLGLWLVFMHQDVLSKTMRPQQSYDKNLHNVDRKIYKRENQLQDKFIDSNLQGYHNGDIEIFEIDAIVNSFANEETELTERASCVCDKGECVKEDGKEVCKCPPGFGNFSSTKCRACDCGTPDTNCIWEQGFQASKVCFCKPGTGSKDGKCVECKCGPDSNCTFTYEGFFKGYSKHCICKPGYHDVNGICFVSPCSSNPCKNGGKCLVLKNQFKCECIRPYKGITCEISLCLPNPCQNNGTCEIEGENYRCKCNSPFHGRNCEADPCTENPCQNGGTCVQTEFSFRCECRFPYIGDICQDTSICADNPCYNGGTCEPDGDFYKCKCLFPYIGENCEDEWIESTAVTETDSTDGSSDDFLWTANETSEFPEIINRTTDFYKWTSNDSSEFTENFTETTIINQWTTSNFSEFTGFFNETSGTTDEISDFTDDFNTTYSPTNFTEEFNVSIFDIKNFTDSYNLTTVYPGICSQNSDCMNEGVCIRKNNQNYCACLPNFVGYWCEVNLLCEKLHSICLAMGATCKSNGFSAFCDCPSEKMHNTRSGLCESICDPSRCLHGTCEIIERTYKCKCDGGYTGQNCNERASDRSNLWFQITTLLLILLCLILLIFLICQNRK